MTYYEEKQKTAVYGTWWVSELPGRCREERNRLLLPGSKFDVSVFPYITQSLYVHSYLGFTRDNMYLENYRKVEM